MRNIKRVKGLTLIELILGMLILTISMGGFYLGISSMAKYLFQPEKILNSMNVVEYYQHKIANIQLPEDCDSQDELKKIIEVLCHKVAPQTIVQIKPDDNLWSQGQALTFSIFIQEQQPLLYRVETTLLENNKIIFRSQQIKGAS